MVRRQAYGGENTVSRSIRWAGVVTALTLVAVIAVVAPATPSGAANVRTCTSGPVALTFDDGPDPTNTPLVLDILRQKEALATFFVVGQQLSS